VLLAQDGHQASDRIHEGLSEGLINGAVISTLFRKPETVKTIAGELHEIKNDALVILDNEFYINAIAGAEKFGKFSEYGYYSHPLTKKDLASPFKLADHIKKTIDYQIDDAKLRIVTTPCIIVESFEHTSEAITLSLLSGSCEYIADNRKDDVDGIYASLYINEQALLNTDNLPEFLDSLTSYDDVKGFYLVVDKTTSPLAYWSNPATLATMMYITKTLSDNGYEVIVGYAAVPDLLNLAVGAKAISTGWWDNTSSFTQKKFANGGGRRRKKYFSEQLLNSIYIDPELQGAKRLKLIDKITKSNSYDTDLTNDPYGTAWTDAVAIMHKWQSMKAAVDVIDEAQHEEAKLQVLEGLIDTSIALYGELTNAGIKFEPHTGPRKVSAMKQAIALYQKGVV
jgi:hypothetical protein